MKLCIASIIFLIVTFLQDSNGSKLGAVSDEESELLAVAVLYREGDRSPSSSFPNDPYFDPSYWPMGFGQLTEQGIQRQYELGQWLRKRYDGFLPELYNPSDIYVLSTDTDRTLMSGQANLAGLYPPTDSQIWNKNLLWRPIPVHTVPKQLDQVLYMERPCAKYNKLYDEVYDNEFYQDIKDVYSEFFDMVSNLTGWVVDDVDYLYQLQTVLYIYSNYNTSFLPSWYDSLDLETLAFLAGLDYTRYTFNDDMRRLGDGPFFYNLISNFEGVLNGTVQAPKFLMLSAHESTIASILNGMTLFDNHIPEFASCLIWELRKNDKNEQFIDLFYKRNSTEDAEHLTLFGEVDCNYGTFKKILNPITVDLATWEKECADIDD